MESSDKIAGSAFDALFQSSSEALLLEGPDGRLLAANQIACTLLGFAHDELGDMARSALCDPADTRAQALFASRDAEGRARGELRLRKKDGSFIEAEVATARYRAADGQLCATLAVRDLTLQKESERLAFEAQEQMGFALDAGEIGYWNYALRSGVGYRSPWMFRVLGREGPIEGWGYADFIACIHPEDLPHVQAAHEAARLGNGRYETEFRVVWPDGSVHWLLARGRFYYDAAGQAERISGVQFDISQRHAAEAQLATSQARFKSVIDLSQDGILIQERTKVRYANQAAARLLGAMDPAELEGINVPDHLVPEVRELATQRREQLATHGGAVPYMETRLVRLDGTVIDIELAGSAVWEDGAHIIHTQIREISERKRHEREILALNQSLEARVEARTRELEMANRELESYSYMVAHDLRAPLRAISGFTGMLKETLPAKMAEDEKRYLGIIVDNVDRMNKLIEGLLQFSRSGRGTVTRQKVDARAFVDSVILEMPTRGQAQFEIGPLPALHADPILLRQIFVNLIDNALKYSRDQPQPRIEISASEAPGEDVISIADNGVGFEPAYSGKLFGVFQRLHSQSEFEGTGVGLAIVRKIVERHGGRVWAEGAVGQGARFYFSLPRQPVA